MTEAPAPYSPIDAGDWMMIPWVLLCVYAVHRLDPSYTRRYIRLLNITWALILWVHIGEVIVEH